MSEASPTPEAAPKCVSRLRLEQFGCFTEPVELALTSLHALIGPNDTGKTTALRALEHVLRLRRWAGSMTSIDEVGRQLGYARPTTAIELEVATAHHVTLTATTLTVRDGSTSRTWPTMQPHAFDARWWPEDVPDARFLRLDPDELKAASPLLREEEPPFFLSERGRGLGAMLDALRDRDEAAYDTVRASFLDTFPSVERLQLQRSSDQGKMPAVRMRSGEEVPAARMSEGMLYWLALAALRASGFHGVVLLEEPENGLHPARVGDAVRVLRDASARMQIVMATHSPLVINELEGHEVTVLHRDERDIICATRLDRSFDYEARSRVYSNGELWLAHADGEREHDLFAPPRRP